jgi:Flp pilus assembly protein TadD
VTAGFTLDDLRVIVENPMVQGTEPAGRLLIWVDRPENYRPLTMLSFAANRRLGASATGFHLVNVLLHALVSVLAFEIARVVLRSTLGAAAAGALFAVHPIHTEAVTSLVGRAELLAALFVLLCLLALVRAGQDGLPRGRRALWLGASLGAFAAGLLCKESALMAIALCGVVHWWVSPERRVRRTLLALAPYAVLGIAYLGWRRHLVGALGMPVPPHFVDNPLAYVTPWSRVLTALVVLSEYLGLLAAPITLSSDYSFNQVPVVTSVLDPRFFVAVGVVSLLVIVIAVSARRAPAVLVASAFFLVPLLVTSNVLVVIGTIKAERLLYLPSLGWCLAAGCLVAALRERWPRPVLGALAIALCLLTVRTWVRNEDWRDNETAHAAAVRTAPASAKTQYNLARDRLSDRRFDEAIRHLRASVAIYPDWAESQSNLGGALALTGNLAEARAHLAEAARLDPRSARIKVNLAQVLLRQGQLGEAIAQLETAARLDPGLSEATGLLASLQEQRGRLAQTVATLSAAVAADPRNADAQNDLGVALFRLGRVEEAIPRFETALRIRADHPRAQQNLRAALAQRAPSR